MAAQYHVSDALQDRHPYKAATGFQELAVQDRAKLFGGFGEPSFKYNIESLAREDISVEEKTKMLRHLLGQLTSADAKVRAINYGLVSSLTWLAERNLGSPVDELVCQAVRSLAVVPAGVFSLYRNQALPSVLSVLAGRLEQPADEAMLRAREGAGEAVKQLTVGWHAKWLLLGEDAPEGMVGMGIEPPGTPDVDTVDTQEDRRQMGHRVVETLTHLIISYNANNGISVRLLRSALEALANLSADARGLDMCLVCGVLREVDELLHKFASAPAVWIGNRLPTTLLAGEVVFLTVTVVWNVCMDPVGKRQEEALTSLPFSLGKLLLSALRFPLQYMRLKATIVGAICAIFIFEDAKGTSVAPLFRSPADAAIFDEDLNRPLDIAGLLLQLLREANAALRDLRAGQPVFDVGENTEVRRDDVEAAVKNCVQAVRLLTERPSVRPRVAELIAGDRDLCLQIFRGTLIEQLMATACGVKL